MKLLITGVSGQVGSQLFQLSNHENYGIYFNNKPDINVSNLSKLDIGERNDVLSFVRELKPDCIVHSAAATKVDWCETNRDEAWRINVTGTKNLVDAATEVGSKFIYISTDYVFDGSKGNYIETDNANPVNFYGKTKLEGEIISKGLKDSLIMRTSLVFGNSTNSFVSWVLGKLKTGNVESPHDMTTSPTYAFELSEAILKAIEKDLVGTYHSAGNEHLSRYDFARKIAKAFGLDDSNIKPVERKDLNFAAERPENSSLNISKILNEGIKFSDIDTALKNLRNRMDMSG